MKQRYRPQFFFQRYGQRVIKIMKQLKKKKLAGLTVLTRPEILASLTVLAAYFMPWFVGSRTLPGYSLAPFLTQKLTDHGLSGHLTLLLSLLIYAIPIAAIGVLFLTMKGSRTRLIATAAGMLPLIVLVITLYKEQALFKDIGPGLPLTIVGALFLLIFGAEVDIRPLRPFIAYAFAAFLLIAVLISLLTVSPSSAPSATVKSGTLPLKIIPVVRVSADGHLLFREKRYQNIENAIRAIEDYSLWKEGENRRILIYYPPGIPAGLYFRIKFQLREAGMTIKELKEGPSS